SAAAVDARQVQTATAVRARRALLEFLRAAARRRRAHEPAVLAAAISTAALVAGLARVAVDLARIDDPVAARVAREELLRRQVERGVRRIAAGRPVEIDRGDPELLRRRRRADVVIARVAPERID